MKELTMTKDTNGTYHATRPVRNKAEDVLTAIDAHYYQLRSRAYFMMYLRYLEEGNVHLARKAFNSHIERATQARELLLSLIP